MQSALASVLVLCIVTACGANGSIVGPLMDEYDGAVHVRVVDAQGAPVAGAEVRVPASRHEPSTVAEFLLSGSVGRVDRLGQAFETDEQGESRVTGVTRESTIVARDPGRWGTVTWYAPTSREVTITLAREVSLRVVCADAEGRPGTGAFVFVSVVDPINPLESGDEVVWGQEVTSPDGTLDVPHAQYWRALQREGREVTIAALVWWGDEMLGDWGQQPFPTDAETSIAFEVSPLGWIDVHADASVVGAPGDLRWLDPPPDPDDLDDIPEFPICAAPSWRMALPLGQRYEVVFQVPGFVDPRVAFDGPKVAGERVEVVIDRLEPAAVVTVRLVDEQGSPLADRYCDAWFDRAGERIEAEVSEWSDADGRVVVELPPGAGGTLHIDIGQSRISFNSAESHRSALVSVEQPVVGATQVGDIVCRPASD